MATQIAIVWVVSEFAWEAARAVEEALFFGEGDNLDTYKKYRKKIKFLRRFAEAESEMRNQPFWEIRFTDSSILSVTKQ